MQVTIWYCCGWNQIRSSIVFDCIHFPYINQLQSILFWNYILYFATGVFTAITQTIQVNLIKCHDCVGSKGVANANHLIFQCIWQFMEQKASVNFKNLLQLLKMHRFQALWFTLCLCPRPASCNRNQFRVKCNKCARKMHSIHPGLGVKYIVPLSMACVCFLFVWYDPITVQ